MTPHELDDLTGRVRRRSGQPVVSFDQQAACIIIDGEVLARLGGAPPVRRPGTRQPVKASPTH